MRSSRRAGTAVVEVRIGEALVDVRVVSPAAVTLPIAGRITGASAVAATG